jgi:hypothetical protein
MHILFRCKIAVSITNRSAGEHSAASFMFQPSRIEYILLMLGTCLRSEIQGCTVHNSEIYEGCTVQCLVANGPFRLVHPSLLSNVEFLDSLASMVGDRIDPSDSRAQKQSGVCDSS